MHSHSNVLYNQLAHALNQSSNPSSSLLQLPRKCYILFCNYPTPSSASTPTNPKIFNPKLFTNPKFDVGRPAQWGRLVAIGWLLSGDGTPYSPIVPPIVPYFGTYVVDSTSICYLNFPSLFDITPPLPSPLAFSPLQALDFPSWLLSCGETIKA